MKRIIYWAAIMLLAVTACTQRYELDLPLALSRAEMRFKNSGDTYYVLVYSDGPWKAELGKNVDWVTLSATSGEGNAELKVTTDLNPGVSRGVTLYVSNSHGSRELYISQEKGTTDAGNYSFVKESVDVLRSAAKARIMSGTNLDEDTVSGAIDTVIYASEDEEPWIHDIEVSPKRVSFRVDENNTGAPRSAEVQISFPLARWDTPVKASFKVNQSVSDPIELEARVTPIDGTGIQFLEDDQFVLLDADGSSTISASIGDLSSESATLLVNGDAVKSGILGGVYPEDYVSRWSNGKVYISVEPKLVRRGHLLSDVDSVYNAVLTKGSYTGDTLFYGQGAGKEATASAVVGDIIELLGAPERFSLPDFALKNAEVAKDETPVRYYVRLASPSQPAAGALLDLFGEDTLCLFTKREQDPWEEKIQECVSAVITPPFTPGELDEKLGGLDGICARAKLVLKVLD